MKLKDCFKVTTCLPQKEGAYRVVLGGLGIPNMRAWYRDGKWLAFITRADITKHVTHWNYENGHK